jgi:small subunit ribosomal protein SAe
MSQIPAILNISEEDIRRMIGCGVHLGIDNLDASMSRYVHGRNENGVHIIDIRKTFEKLQLAARVIAAVENPKDVCVVGLSPTQNQAPPVAQRAVLKFAKYVGCRSVAGRFTPGTFTNQIQSHFLEPRLLIVSDPLLDHQPVIEASYVNTPVIAFCNTNASLRNVDIAIPCNTRGPNSIALMYWMLAREVLRLHDRAPRHQEWDVMVDMFIYRDPESESDKTEEFSKPLVSFNDRNWNESVPENNYATGGESEWRGDGFQADVDAPTGETETVGWVQ